MSRITRTAKGPITMRPALIGALFAAWLAFAASPAGAAYGDDYGAAPINGHPDAIQDAPAIPGEHAFWAGTCDRAAAVGFFGDLTASGGFGSRPETVLAGTNDHPRIGGPGFLDPMPGQVAVDAPHAPDHCLDFGAQTHYDHQSTVWQSLPFDTGKPHPSGLGRIGQAEPAGDYAPQWRLPAETQAGAHPDGTTTFAWNRNSEGIGTSPGKVDGSVDNIYVDLPPGFVGNPQAVAMCTAEQFRSEPPLCPPESQIGVLRLNLEGICAGVACNLKSNWDTTYPLYNLEPRKGNVAEIGFHYVQLYAAVRLVAKARTDSDFGVTAFAGQISAALPVISQQVTLWGVPWAPENDIWRPKLGHMMGPVECLRQPGVPLSVAGSRIEYIPPAGLPEAHCQATYDPAWGEIKPFLTNPTDCTEPTPTVRLATDAFQHPGAFTSEGDPDLPPFPAHAEEGSNWKTYTSVSPQVTGCEKLDFQPELDARPTTSTADSPTGLDVDLTIPQNEDPDGLATAQLKRTVVELPEGLTLNPSGANGLAACSSAQFGVRTTSGAYPAPIRFNNDDPSDGEGRDCPEASKIAEVKVETPLLDPADHPTGEVYIARPFDNPFDSLLAIYIAIRSPDRGFIAKLAGEVKADPKTGRLITTFDHSPQLPFEHFTLDFEAGASAPLSTPATCGTHATQTELTPWSHPESGPPADSRDSWQITRAPGGGECATSKSRLPFTPDLEAGTVSPLAGAHTPFVMRLTKPDAQQEIKSLQMRLPQGLTARLSGIPYCSEASLSKFSGKVNTAPGTAQAEIANPSCPAASRIGRVTIGAGSGPAPFYLKTARAYLAGPYKGAPLSIAVIAPAKAGPFDLGTVMVRSAVHVNDRTAQITVVSDQFPTIVEGIPVKLGDLRVVIDRKNFTLNPTSCEPMQIAARVGATNGKSANLQNRFQVGDCAALGFNPRFGMFNLGKGRRSTLRSFNPPMRFTLLPRPGDANVGPTQVTLPSSIILDQSNLDTICTRDQFASRDCPAGSVVGFARAWSPLLDEPLAGPVYLGSSPNPLPDVIADLQGQVGVVLQGQVDSAPGGRIRNTFNVVPDAPVSRFDLHMFGGKNTGILVNSRDLCRSRERGVAAFNAHNGRVSLQRPVLRTAFRGCRKVLRAEARRQKLRRIKVIRAFKQGRISRAQAKRLLGRGTTRAAARRAIRS